MKNPKSVDPSVPDGRLPGREILLAMYVPVAHHRGQDEIYLRDKGIRPRLHDLKTRLAGAFRSE